MISKLLSTIRLVAESTPAPTEAGTEAAAATTLPTETTTLGTEAPTLPTEATGGATDAANPPMDATNPPMDATGSPGDATTATTAGSDATSATTTAATDPTTAQTTHATTAKSGGHASPTTAHDASQPAQTASASTSPTEEGGKAAEQLTGNGAIWWILFVVSVAQGVLWGFFGKRLFRPAALVSGILAGALTGAVCGRAGELLAGGATFDGALVLEAAGNLTASLPTLAGAMLGAALMGLLGIPLFYVMMFLAGFGAGAAATYGLLLLTRLNGAMSDPLMLIILLAACAGFAVARLSAKYRIFFTSMTGAFHLTLAVLAVLMSVIGTISDESPLKFAKLLIVAAVLSMMGFWVAGFLVQRRWWKRRTAAEPK